MKLALFFYFSLVFMSFASISVVLDLIFLMFSVILMSFVIFFLFNSFWIPFLVNLSVVGGLVVLISFVIMIQPNFSSFSLVFLDKIYFVFFPFLFIYFYLFDFFYCFSSFSFFGGSFMNFSMINLFPFFSLYVFLISFLLFMLVVIDEILKMKCGSFIYQY
uniref:NADH dehydrogenase subunit 6 n=1 Tax=Falcolipeurus marginalis TaxID=236517 RepID=UPI00211E3EE6|nr:NADH dehydrogenase subunit 6 [Falcolipeurus marginalis]UTT72597.1 NADH dehydrogenase subunit 6 [Falcolipeurus marginalis]